MSALITGKSIRTNNGDRAELPARQQFPLANQDAALAVRPKWCFPKRRASLVRPLKSYTGSS